MKPSAYPPKPYTNALAIMLIITAGILLFSLGVWVGRNQTTEPPPSRVNWPN